MIETLEFIRAQMETLEIPYEFMAWSSEVKYPYFVGEISEIEPITEDGLEEKKFIITGFTRNSWIELMAIQEKIRKAFPPIGGKAAVLDNGSGIAVFYDTALPIPTGEADLKKIEIYLTIKLWKVE